MLIEGRRLHCKLHCYNSCKPRDVDEERNPPYEQNATRPPRGVLDAFRHVTNSLRPASNMQCLHRNHQICVSKNTQATHLFVPHYRHDSEARDQKRHLTSGVAGVPWVHHCWVESDGSAAKGDWRVHVHQILKRV